LAVRTSASTTDVSSRIPQYRPDIDGLRAIAIVLVVGYHVGLPGFEGGFVGVGVFFVVSGFLITVLLLRELERDGRIALGDFYARRVRRILPALTLVVVATLGLGLFLLLPWELTRTAKSAVATGAFVSNIYFWRTTGGYFGAAAESQPLLHTWTLAVEEQFYLLWPVLLTAVFAFAARTRNRLGWVAAALAIVCAGSLGISIVMATRAPLAGFFLLPSRLWELGAGGLLAFASLRVRRTGSAAVLGAVGLAAIFVTAATVSSSTHWPGAGALVPVLGTLAVIIAGTGPAPRNPISRVLSVGPMVSIGLLSYSWYLWHWPLLTLVRDATLERNVVRDSFIALAALGIAALTYRWVEQPIRQRRIAVVRAVPSTLLVGATLVVVMIGGGLATGRAAERLASTGRYARYVEAIHGSGPHCPDVHSWCVAQRESGAGNVALVGDSHAGSWSPAFVDAANAYGFGLRVGSWGGCPFVAGLELWDSLIGKANPSCPRRVDDWLATLKDPANDIDTVVIANFSFPGRQIVRPSGITDVMRNGHRLRIDAANRQWATKLRETVASLTDAGKRVIILQSVPGLEKSAPECAARKGPSACSTLRSVIDRYRNPTIKAERRAVEGNPKASVWDPIDAFCTQTECLAERDGLVFYSDNNHPTTRKVRSLTGEIERLLSVAPS